MAWQAERITRKPHISLLPLSNARQGFFEGGELEAVLARLPEFLHPPFTFAYNTGWRVRSEVLPLTWNRVDLEAGTVRLYPGTTKNEDGRVIYLTRELQDIMEAQWQEHLAHYPDCPWVFHRNGKRIPDYYYGYWYRACRAAGLIGKIPHDFRRTAVRNMVRAGIPERVAMQMTGHKTRTVFDRYHIVSDGDLREAARRLERTITPQTTTISTTLPEVSHITH